MAILSDEKLYFRVITGNTKISAKAYKNCGSRQGENITVYRWSSFSKCWVGRHTKNVFLLVFVCRFWDQSCLFDLVLQTKSGFPLQFVCRFYVSKPYFRINLQTKLQFFQFFVCRRRFKESRKPTYKNGKSQKLYVGGWILILGLTDKTSWPQVSVKSLFL